jgi:hypothetical protein
VIARSDRFTLLKMQFWQIPMRFQRRLNRPHIDLLPTRFQLRLTHQLVKLVYFVVKAVIQVFLNDVLSSEVCLFARLGGCFV